MHINDSKPRLHFHSLSNVILPTYYVHSSEISIFSVFKVQIIVLIRAWNRLKKRKNRFSKFPKNESDSDSLFPKKRFRFLKKNENDSDSHFFPKTYVRFRFQALVLISRYDIINLIFILKYLVNKFLNRI